MFFPFVAGRVFPAQPRSLHGYKHLLSELRNVSFQTQAWGGPTNGQLAGNLAHLYYSSDAVGHIHMEK